MSASYASFCSVRHYPPLCKPGMWHTNLTLALGYPGDGHVHADCVVDDFGNLRIVNVYGMTDGPNWSVETRGAE